MHIAYLRNAFLYFFSLLAIALSCLALQMQTNKAVGIYNILILITLAALFILLLLNTRTKVNITKGEAH